MANLPELRASCKEGDIELVNMSQQRLLESSETSLEVSDARKALQGNFSQDG